MSSADRRLSRRLVGALASLGLLATGLVVVASPAQAQEVYPRPYDGVVQLSGHGYGHGRGLSQWGAEGAALSGMSWQDILDFYYPGTTRSTVGNPTIRVSVAGALGYSAVVRPADGLRASYPSGTTYALPVKEGDGTPILRYAVTSDQYGSVHLTYTRSGKTPATVSWPADSAASVTLDNTTSASLVVEMPGGGTVTYSGRLSGVARGTSTAPVVSPVLALPLQTYLRSVVPSESYASWQPDALAAQAVAARSYANWYLTYPKASYYDICDTTACQVFNGVSRTTTRGTTNYYYGSTDAAVSTTSGVVLSYGCKPAFTEFSASNGGWTVKASVGASVPYTVAKADPYDATPSNPQHSWSTTVKVSTIEATWRSLGSYTGMRITGRDGHGDWGGRVTSMVLEGTGGTVSLSGTDFQAALGLKSEWFTPANFVSAPSFPRDVTGDRKADVLAVVGSTGELRLYAGSGKGYWQSMKVLAPSGWSGYATVLTAGTWDQDAYSDVLAQTTGGDLMLFRGGYGGVLGTPTKIGAGWGANNLVLPVGDFGGDGLTDLLARRASDGALLLYSGDGRGGFLPTRTVGAGWSIFTAVLSPGDVTGDGKVDVLARAKDGTLYLYPGNGRGGWLTRRVVGKGWQSFTSITSAGDFTGDGKADVFARTAGGTLWLYPGDGAGGWLPRRAVGSGWQIFSTVLP
ncbi:MAG: SpoIID/LytB domain-containing protein [Oryzihumus sp.]